MTRTSSCVFILSYTSCWTLGWRSWWNKRLMGVIRCCCGCLSRRRAFTCLSRMRRLSRWTCSCRCRRIRRCCWWGSVTWVGLMRGLQETTCSRRRRLISWSFPDYPISTRSCYWNEWTTDCLGWVFQARYKSLVPWIWILTGTSLPLVDCISISVNNNNTLYL